MTNKLRRARRAKRNPTPPSRELIPKNWTHEQALAVYDFCTAMQEHVWRQYRQTLTDQMLAAQIQAKAAQQRDDRTYPLPFDDEPF